MRNTTTEIKPQFSYVTLKLEYSSKTHKAVQNVEEMFFWQNQFCEPINWWRDLYNFLHIQLFDKTMFASMCLIDSLNNFLLEEKREPWKGRVTIAILWEIWRKFIHGNQKGAVNHCASMQKKFTWRGQKVLRCVRNPRPLPVLQTANQCIRAKLSLILSYRTF